MADDRNSGYPPDSDWDACAHEWREVDSDIGGNRVMVECVKCQCPGEQYIPTGEVYWPAT